MVENITSLASSVHTAISWVLQFWTWLIGIGIPMGVVIMLKFLAAIFRDVKLIKHGDEYTCEYPKNPIWQKHPIVRWFIRGHRPWGVDKKYAKAIKDYNESVELANTEIISISIPKINRVDLGMPIYEGRIRGRPDKFIRRDFIPLAIIDMVIGRSGNDLLIEKKPSGSFDLSYYTWKLARSDSEDKLKKLIKSLQLVREDNIVKGFVLEVYKKGKKKNELEKKFKKKLAKIVYRVRFWIEVLPFRLVKEQGISKR